MSKVVMGDAQSHRGVNNIPRTSSLFVETNITPALKPYYTFKKHGEGEYVSMYKLFMEDNDPTGYTTCMRTFGDFHVWRKMWSSKVFAPVMEDWLIDLEAKMTSEAIEKMRKLDNPTANKWIADKGWEQKRGRPSKAEKARTAAKTIQMRDELADDASRVLIN